MRVLLEHGADPNARDANNSTAVHWAANAGNPVTLHLLLDAGGDPNALNRRRGTPAMLLVTDNDWQQTTADRLAVLLRHQAFDFQLRLEGRTMEEWARSRRSTIYLADMIAEVVYSHFASVFALPSKLRFAAACVVIGGR